jgi:hypothetical protein
MALNHEIEQGKQAKETTTAFFMDVSGAFDNVLKDHLLHTLQQLRYPIPIQYWVDHFVSNCTTALSFDGRKQDLSPILTGIPQGSPASPILSLLYLSPLFNELTMHHPCSWTPSYIDDVAIVIQSKSKAYNSCCLEAVARTAFKWAANNAFRFNGSKSEMMHFHHKRNGNTTDDLNITLPNGTIISPDTKGVSPDVVWWIGIWFDRKINFKHHVMLKAEGGK